MNSSPPGCYAPEENGGSDRALKTNLLGEKCTAEDVQISLILASDKAKFITGQTYL